jgi:hypothetical protein
MKFDSWEMKRCCPDCRPSSVQENFQVQMDPGWWIIVTDSRLREMGRDSDAGSQNLFRND